MIGLLTAIKQQFGIAPLSTTFTGGIYRDRRPPRQQGAPPITYPYVVVQPVESPKKTCFGAPGPSRSDVTVRFVITHTTDDACGAAAELLENTLLTTLLPTTNGEQMVNVISLHDARPVPDALEPLTGPQNESTWLVTLVYSTRK